MYGFFGPNGAGKTTILRLLLGRVRPSSGSAVVLGAPLLGIDGPPIIAEQRSQMGKERLLEIADLAERQGARFLAAARELKMQLGIVNAHWPQAEPG